MRVKLSNGRGVMGKVGRDGHRQVVFIILHPLLCLILVNKLPVEGVVVVQAIDHLLPQVHRLALVRHRLILVDYGNLELIQVAIWIPDSFQENYGIQHRDTTNSDGSD